MDVNGELGGSEGRDGVTRPYLGSDMSSWFVRSIRSGAGAV